MNYCASDACTIKEIMETFENNHDRVAIIVNSRNKVMGVVSQGDIIRALTNDIDIHAKINTILLPSFIYLDEYNMEKAYKVFKEKNISLLPIVNKNFEIQSVITINDIFQYLEKSK
ncbi:MAG: CBS domain-containing protein [Bacteroidales bacterium]|jgi:predicted transcriptional regulator|nr:CBS domain-containing protein [Bacteroidales bacterium]